MKGRGVTCAMNEMIRKIAVLLTALALSFALTAPAFAQDSSIQGYNDEAPRVENKIEDVTEEGPTAPAVESRGGGGGGGSLPFTGLDVGLVVAAGGLLFLMGLGMRRITSRSPGSA